MLLCDHQGALSNTAVATFPGSSQQCVRPEEACREIEAASPKGRLLGLVSLQCVHGFEPKAPVTKRSRGTMAGLQEASEQKEANGEAPTEGSWTCKPHGRRTDARLDRVLQLRGKMARTLFPEGVVGLKIHPSMNRDVWPELWEGMPNITSFEEMQMTPDQYLRKDAVPWEKRGEGEERR